MACDQAGIPLFFTTQNSNDRVEEHLLFGRLEQVARATERLEAGSIAALTHGGEDDNFDIFYCGIILDSTCRLFTIHARHLHVKQYHMIEVARTMCIA